METRVPSPQDLSETELQELSRLVEFKVRHFLRNRPDRPQELPDLMQDVLLRVIARLRQHDPRRGSLTTFVARIADSALIDASRYRGSAKRNPDREQHPTRGDDRRRRSAWDGDRGEDRGRLADLAIDLRDAVAALPPELQRLADGLREWTPTELAEREQIDRSTVYRRLQALRDRWDDHTLRDYLEP